MRSIRGSAAAVPSPRSRRSRIPARSRSLLRASRKNWSSTRGAGIGVTAAPPARLLVICDSCVVTCSLGAAGLPLHSQITNYESPITANQSHRTVLPFHVQGDQFIEAAAPEPLQVESHEPEPEFPEPAGQLRPHFWLGQARDLGRRYLDPGQVSLVEAHAAVPQAEPLEVGLRLFDADGPLRGHGQARGEPA